MVEERIQRRSLRLMLALACTNLVTMAAPGAPALGEMGEAPVLGRNSSYESRMSDYRVLINDFFTPDNSDPGTVVHLVGTNETITGDYIYNPVAGLQLRNILFSRQLEHCGGDVMVNPPTGAILRIRDYCVRKFTESQIEKARAELDRARREVHRPQYLVKVEFP